jgi:anti-sigma factor RsiW
MDCTHCAEDLTAFLDGELSNTASERVRAHLQSCASCTEDLRSLREVGAFVALHSHELEPRPESWNLVRARINESTLAAPSRFWRFNYGQIAIATAAVVAALALGYMQYQQIQRQNLDKYIAQYVQQREAQIRVQAENNPFMEVNRVFDGNPFRSEDQ